MTDEKDDALASRQRDEVPRRRQRHARAWFAGIAVTFVWIIIYADKVLFF